MATPLPDVGDVLLVDFDPMVGREQSGRRPAVVVSTIEYHGISPYVLVCPVTSNVNPWPFKVVLPPGGRIRGAVLVDQVKSVDRSQRVLRQLGALPNESMVQIRSKLLVLMGLDLKALLRDGPD